MKNSCRYDNILCKNECCKYRWQRAYEADNLRVRRDEEGDEHRRDGEAHAEGGDERVGGAPNGGHGAQTLGDQCAAGDAEHTTEAGDHSEHQRNTKTCLTYSYSTYSYTQYIVSNQQIASQITRRPKSSDFLSGGFRIKVAKAIALINDLVTSSYSTNHQKLQLLRIQLTAEHV